MSEESVREFYLSAEVQSKNDNCSTPSVMSDGNSFVIDYVVMKKELMKRVRDVKVIPVKSAFHSTGF